MSTVVFQKPRRGVPVLVFVLGLIAAGAAGLFLGRSTAAPDAAEPPITSLETEIEPPTDANPAERANARRARDQVYAARIQSCEEELEELQRLLAAAQGNASRYEEGLEKAVEQLNQVDQARQRAEGNARRLAAAPPARSPGARPGRTAVSAFQPSLNAAGNTAVVAGRVYNAGSADAGGYVEIEVFRDGASFSTDRVYLDVPAGSGVDYDLTMDIVQGGSYSVKAYWDGN